MTRPGSSLHSSYLIDIKRQFVLGRGANPRAKGRIEFYENQSMNILDESLEIVAYLHVRELYLYQSLVIWGDSVASLDVRENVRKRQDRIVIELKEFVLAAEPHDILDAFWWTYRALRRLCGTSQDIAMKSNDELVREISERWCRISSNNAQ